jgi:transcription elongation factor GreA
MNNKVFMITQEGLDQLKEQLTHLKEVRRKEIAQKIREAKEFGDLSENAEYHEAKEDQAFVEGQIIDLENKIKNAKIIDKVSSDIVQIGSSVTIEVVETKEKMDFDLVGSMEADVFNNKISNESPLGSAILDKKKGDVVIVKAPKGEVEYKIVSIN